jgi:conjugal transfer pilus assembly protein TraA
MKSITMQPMSLRLWLGICALVVAFMWMMTPVAYAGADATFAPAFQIATDYLEGTGGKIIAIISLVGGLIGMASGFRLSQVAGPVGVGIGAGVGVPIVTAAVGAMI